jgi:hypothetical protein
MYRAFTGMSAAMAEPVNAATAVTAIANFFMEPTSYVLL